MGNAISDASTLTTIHLAWLAVFAVLVVIGLVYGARLKRQRRDARKTEEQRVEVAAKQPADPRLIEAEPATQVPTPVPPEPEAEPRLSAAGPLADEPVAAAAPLDASPATAADLGPAPLPSSAVRAADAPVTTLKGLGPKVATQLADLGITTVGQIAALDDAEADALDAQLGAFRGRMARDRWIEQARFLAADDRAGFEAVFGKL